MNVAKFISVGEKAYYPFKSYPSQPCETLLFPGCAFASQFPRTMDALAQRCREAGFGVAYDCCGSSLDGYGEFAHAERVMRQLNERFDKLGVKRLVLVCPNCLNCFEGKTHCETLSIFDVFDELGVEGAGEFSGGSLFTPCPDKKDHALEAKLRSLAPLDAVHTMEGVACCGLRPDIASKGPETVQKFSNLAIGKADNKPIYSYCASCLGQFARMGYTQSYHVVSVLLGINEEPDAGRAFLNRAKRKFDRNTNPIRPAYTKVAESAPVLEINPDGESRA